MRVFPRRLLRLHVDPVDHTVLDVLKKVRGPLVVLERLAYPHKVLVGGRIKPQVAHVLRQGRGLVVRAVEDAVDNGLVVGALLQRDLNLVACHSEGSPRSLVEEPHVSVLLTFDDGQELVPDLRDVGIPLEHGEVLGDGALRQVHNLELGPECALPDHEDDLVLIPFDDDLVANWDVILALDFVLVGVGPLVLQPEGHDQQRPVIGDDQMPLLSPPEVLQPLCLRHDVSLVKVAARENLRRSVIVSCGSPDVSHGAKPMLPAGGGV
mmetsp:Transcript_17177/g.39037  ORF Transcript_17177/g.39037 Transcript_17177/m.39037 type:complete len:266 (+) Transcript_17177:1084-1881(+)